MIVVYLVWGSTYLAIRVAVRDGAGFPPFIMAGMRVVAASLIMFGWSAAFRKGRRVGWRELGVLFVSGILLWVGGNGLVSWAERTAESAYAALLVGSMPLWVAMMEAIVDRRPPSWRLGGALLIGLAGVGVLNGPVIMAGAPRDVAAAVAILVAAILWGMGTIFQRRKAISLEPEVSSGYQLLFGGIGLLLASTLAGEPRPEPIPDAWLAWGYLILFGSVIAFTSFLKATRLLPMNIVMTYAYVNPVVAVILGRIILAESITWWTIGGSVLIVLGVMGVFHEQPNGKGKLESKH